MDLREAELMEEAAPPHPTDPVIERPVRGPWLQYRVPRGLEWNRVRLPVANVSPTIESLRILHLTDLHLTPVWSEVYDEFLRRLRDEAVDLLLVTGDFVDDKRTHVPALAALMRMVQGFTARLGCFGILGNHDNRSMFAELEGTNITLLDGKRHVVDVDGAPLELIGLPGLSRLLLTPEVLRSFPPHQPGLPRIVLSHYPDSLPRARSLKPDMFLAGHTHGGQICLPSGMPIIRHDTLPRHLCTGIHRVEDTWLVVNRGFGFTGMPLRIHCPAEVIEIRLDGSRR